MTKKTSQVYTRWKPAPTQVDDQQRLEQQLNQVTDSAEFGPVPGAYFPLTWNLKGDPEGGVPQGIAGAYCLPTGYQGQRQAGEPNVEPTFGMVPIFLGVYIDAGQLDYAVATESTKIEIPSPPAPAPPPFTFALQQGQLLHPTDVTLDIAPLGAAWPWIFNFKHIGPVEVDLDLAIPIGRCQRFEQTVDFPTSPVRGFDRIELQVVNSDSVNVLTVFMIFKQVSTVDNYRKT